MTMRAMLKKISPPQTRCLMERFLHLKCNCWVKSIREVFKEEKLLQHEGGDHGRLLLSMKILQPDKTYSKRGLGSLGGGTIELTTASPHTGVVQNTNKLEIHTGLFEMPRQAVNGLICITTQEAFLIYNPASGDMSDWIRMPPPRARNRRQVETIALGFSPISNQYKVICMSVTLEKKPARVIEVLTLGENGNAWRRMDAARVEQAGLTALVDGVEQEFVDGPLYVNGVIHWRIRVGRDQEDIMEFHVESEEFSYFRIHDFAVSPSFRLMEVDGRVAVMKRVSDYEASVWVIHFDDNDTVEWCEEKITMPYAWTADSQLSIEALAGTNLILIQQELQNCIFCYNRETKECQKFAISPGRGPPHDWERIIQL